MRGVRSSLLHDERGVVGVMVAVVVVAVFGAAAIAIDLGNGWAHRREIVTGVDAAALAAAQTYALGGNGCASTAGDYLRRNVSDATMTGCRYTRLSPTAGQVEVDADLAVDFYFAPVLGIADGTTHGATTARYGMPAAIRGLRPFGLCVRSQAMRSWVSSGFSTSRTFTIPYGKDQPDDCGDAPGNWGLIDFNGGSNSNQQTRSWVRDGYPGLVGRGWYQGDPGAFSNSLPISSLVGTTFSLPVFRDYDDGNGATAEFRIIGFVNVELVSYRATGSEDDRYLRVRFHTGIVDGTCCGGGSDFGTRVINICAVEGKGRDC
jgi:Flp pilus assembly protein TadG